MNPSSLYIQNGKRAGTVLPLSAGRYIIGQDVAHPVFLPDDGVSRNHAQITVEAKGTWIVDLGSASGTYVNGQQIAQPIWLRHNDTIRLGDSVTIIYRSLASATPPPRGYPSATPRASAPRKKRRGLSCWSIAAILIIISLCALLVFGGGGYYLYSTGKISRRTIMNAIGMGAGEISFANLGDSRISANLIRLDTETGSPENFQSLSLESLDIGGIGAIPPGNYELQLSTASGIPAGGSCHLTIQSGDIFHLVVVPEGIAITKEGYDVSYAAEVHFQTSPLCRP